MKESGTDLFFMAEATRCSRAGDTAWAPRCSEGRTAGSAGLRRRNAQLRWAMRGQDPLKEQQVPRRTSGLLGDRTRSALRLAHCTGFVKCLQLPVRLHDHGELTHDIG